MKGGECMKEQESNIEPMIPGVWYIKGKPRPEIKTPLEGFEFIRKQGQEEQLDQAPVVSKK